MSQLVIEGVERKEPQANRGKSFEDMLDNAHAMYERTGRAKIHHLLNAWDWCGWNEFKKLNPYYKAVVSLPGGDRPIKRVKTPWDYSGVARGHAVAFDAKEFSGTSIALFQLTQVEHVSDFERAGGVAGFMVWAKAAQRVYWLKASVARELCDRASVVKKGRVKGVIKSLNLEWFEQNAPLLMATRPGDMIIDWLPSLQSMLK